MQSLQTVQPVRHQGPHTPTADKTTGLAQDPQGVVGLYIRGRRVARLEGDVDVSDELVAHSPEGMIDWVRATAAHLYWEQIPALLLLQGATLMKVLERHFILLSGLPRPAWSPRPGFDSVIIAEVRSAPGNQGPPELFTALTLHETHTGG